MRKQFLLALFLSGILALQPGCKRKTEQDQQATINEPSQTTTDSGVEMILIPAGQFVMGDQEEIDAAPHEVVISAFSMDRTLVTQAHYQAIMQDNPSRWTGDENPVEQVRWSDAVRFCNQRSIQEGLAPCYDLETWTCDFDANGYRLPTEAEWEYAYRAGTQTAYFMGSDRAKLSDYAWFDENAEGHPQPVAQKLPNPWGLYDMCGNLWQWCNDFYQVDYYEQSPKENPRGPATGETKVVRGGAWKFSAESCRSGYRYNENPGYVDACFGYDIYGFRCVRNAPDDRSESE